MWLALLLAGFVGLMLSYLAATLALRLLEPLSARADLSTVIPQIWSNRDVGRAYRALWRVRIPDSFPRARRAVSAFRALHAASLILLLASAGVFAFDMVSA